LGSGPFSSDNDIVMAVVLDEVVDEDYEPMLQEISEYAEWLGMSLEQDQDLFWIARDGLKAPLPAAWKPCQSGDGNVFYFNFETGESVWEHPCDEHYRRVYRRAKARRDAPVRLVTISGTCEEEDNSMVSVKCIGSLNGEEIATLVVKPDMKVRVFRSQLAKHLDASKRRLRIMLLDGKLVSDDDERTSMSTLLDVTCYVDKEKLAASKEEQKRQKRELKERRVREYLERCSAGAPRPWEVQTDDAGQDSHQQADSTSSPDSVSQQQKQKSALWPLPIARANSTLATLAAVEAAEADTAHERSGSSLDVSGSSSLELSTRTSDQGASRCLPPLRFPDETRTSPTALEEPDEGELKSIFIQSGGTDVISRQRTPNLRLRPISTLSRQHSAEVEAPSHGDPSGCETASSLTPD
jgi:hypothetical protein